MTRSFNTIWSAEDRQWVGVCDQYPSISYLAYAESDALFGIMRLVVQIDKEIRDAEGRTARQG